jgi:hypothetical protein
MSEGATQTTGAHHWVGEVRKKGDPNSANKVQVMIHGLHNIGDSPIPDSDLPWAHSMMNNTASLNGVGKSVNYLPGSTVFGIFLDPINKQIPIILGALDRSGLPDYSNKNPETDGNIKPDPSAIPPGGLSTALGDSPIKGTGYALPGGTGMLPKDNPFLSKSDFNWGTNKDLHRQETSQTPTGDDGSHIKGAKTKKKQQGADPDNPTAATQDKSMNIHDATLTADPSNISGAIQNALHGMVMLKMMEKMTSPAGIANMATGALSQAFQSIGNLIGQSNMLNALNSIMPAVAASGALNSTASSILNQAIISMLTGSTAGALSNSYISQANTTTTAVQSAVTAINSGNNTSAVQTISGLGGASLGLTPGTLASIIALAVSGGTVSTTIGTVAVTITNVSNDPTTLNIPVLSGNEDVTIAQQAAQEIIAELQAVLGTTNGVLNIQNLTAELLISIILSVLESIESAGLQKVLGVGTSGLIGAAQQLLPDVGGNIQNTLNTHLPKTVLDGGNLSQLMTNATKALSLSKMAFNIAKTIFGGSKAQNTADAAAAAASQAQSTGKPVQMSTVDGALIQATPGYSTVA